MLLSHDGCVVVGSPLRQDRAGDAPEEIAVGPAVSYLHLVDRQVAVNLFLIFDQRPGVLDAPFRPVLLHVEKLDVFGLDHLLLVAENGLQEAEPAASDLRHPVAH